MQAYCDKVYDGGVHERESERLYQDFKDPFAIEAGVFGIFHFREVAQLAKVVEVEKTEKDAEAVADLEIKHPGAENREEHESPDPHGLGPKKGSGPQ